MLKLLSNNILPAASETSSSIKCAEVFCKNEEHFAIICIFCEMKLFDFAEFIFHFKNNHLHIEKVDVKKNEGDNSEQIADTNDDSFEDESYIRISVIPEARLVTMNQVEEIDVLATNCSIDNVTDSENEAELDGDNNSDGECDDDDDLEYTPKILQSSSTEDTDRPYQCKECDRKYKLKRSLITHIKDFHRNHDKTYQCQECNRCYKSARSLFIHQYSHTGQRQFTCDLEGCTKTFVNPKGLSSHKRLVHNKICNMVCEICGHSTNRKSSFDIHKRIHSGEKPYVCKTCGKAFNATSLLREHVTTHSTERPHKCDVCGATFSSPKALYHHRNLHSGIKKYVCKLCGKAYAQAAGLCGHMRQHKAEQF